MIAALLAELDASSAVVLAENSTTGAIFHGAIQCEFRVPFDETVVVFDIDLSTDKLSCICCYGGQRIEFDLVKLRGSQWILPKCVVISDLRAEKRVAFTNKMYSAELISERGAVYGYAVDINRDYLAVSVDEGHRLVAGETVKVIVRLINSNFDVFYNGCSVAQLKIETDGSERVILRLEKPILGVPGQRRHARRMVDSASLQMTGESFSAEPADLNFSIQNISSGGMTVGFRSGSSPDQIVPGMILKSKEPELSYLVVWAKGQSMGVRPLLSDPQHLGKWHKYLDGIAPPDDRKIGVTRKELADMLTRSGLLKGSRREAFGRDIGSHVVANPAADSILIRQRRIVADETGTPVLHINLKRYSESAWLFGDGAAFTDKKGAYNEMLHACVTFTREMMTATGTFPRYLTIIWHHTVKSPDEYAKSLVQQSDSLIIPAAQCSIRAFAPEEGAAENEVAFPLSDLPRETASRRRQIAAKFSPSLFEAFAGMDGSHPILNMELGKYGPYHRAITKVVDVEDFHLLVHRVFTHSVWSTTGVTNSVFVVVPGKFPAERLKAALTTIARDAISFGTDDFLLVFDTTDEPKVFLETIPNPKLFSFLVHDLFLNRTLEHQDDSADRKKS